MGSNEQIEKYISQRGLAKTQGDILVALSRLCGALIETDIEETKISTELLHTTAAAHMAIDILDYVHRNVDEAAYQKYINDIKTDLLNRALADNTDINVQLLRNVK